MSTDNHNIARDRLIFKCIMSYNNFYIKGRQIDIELNIHTQPDMNLINNLASTHLNLFKRDHPDYSIEQLVNNPIREGEIDDLIKRPLSYFLQFK